jgi:hypothetical protein
VAGQGPAGEGLRAALDSVFAGPAYRWEAPRDPLAFLRQWWNALLNWLDQLREANPALFQLLFWGMVLALAALLAHAGWLLWRTVRREPTPEGGGPADGPVRDAAWYRNEADRLAAAGRLLEAMQADLLALLLELDARRLLRFHPGKTPQEHVAEAALAAPDRAELRALVWALYRHAFAREPLSREAADAWRARTASDRYAPAH